MGGAILELARSHRPLDCPRLEPERRDFVEIARALEAHLREAGLKNHCSDLVFLDETRVISIRECAAMALGGEQNA